MGQIVIKKIYFSQMAKTTGSGYTLIRGNFRNFRTKANWLVQETVKNCSRDGLYNILNYKN